MLALKRLFASSTRLVGGPNFDKAPWYYMDLSGIQVAFKNPPPTIPMEPKQEWPREVNLYADAFTLSEDSEGVQVVLFQTDWSYFSGYFSGDYLGHFGGLSLYIAIQNRFTYPENSPGLLDMNEAKSWAWTQISEEFEAVNHMMLENQHKKEGPFIKPLLHRYPKSPEHFETLKQNNLEWFESKIYSGERQESLDRTFYLPIAEERLLLVRFFISAQSIKKSEQTIQQFMENFHVRWPEGKP